MKKQAVLLLLLMLATGILSGCAAKTPAPSEKNAVTEKVRLYYGDQNNEKMVAEEREIAYTQGGEKYKAVLEELIKGPVNHDYRSNISPETKVYGTIRQDHDLIVDFTKEFNQFGGSMAELMAVGSVVNTLTQFEEIKRVKILVEGNELIGPSGEARGFMEAFPTEPDQEKTTEVVLYFGNKDATKVVGEKRNIVSPAEENRKDFIKKVLEELIAGPREKDLFPTIPKEVKVQSVDIREGTAYVDFSEEMHTKHEGGAAGESMTINSIVNTLTEFDDISRVKMTVNGKPMAIEHEILEDPVERNENMIAK